MLEYIGVFLVAGVLGWFVDSAYRSAIDGKLTSNTYFSFFSVVYGLGAVILTAFFRSSTASVWEDVIFGGVLCTMLELGSGIFCERMLHVRLWDYSKNPLNFEGYIDFVHTTYWFLLTALARGVYEMIPFI